MANILIGITASVAAFKVTTLIRDLCKQSHNVKVVQTNESIKFVPTSLIAAIGAEVYNDNLDYNNPNMYYHTVG